MTRVLIVDDAKFMRDKIREILETEDLQVAGEAENGEEAVLLYQEPAAGLGYHGYYDACEKRDRSFKGYDPAEPESESDHVYGHAAKADRR